MQYLIKEWPNRRATLMTDDGVVLWTFNTAEEAREVWQNWCALQKDTITNRMILHHNFDLAGKSLV